MSTEPRKRRVRRPAAPENPPAVDDLRSDAPVKRQCTAENRHGEPCELAPIKGGTVCHKHGGSAPQVKNAARRRLNAMAEPAMIELNKILHNSSTSDRDKLRAIQMVLDRSGYGPSANVKVDAPWEGVFEAVSLVSGEDDEEPEWRKGRYAQPEEDDYEG